LIKAGKRALFAFWRFFVKSIYEIVNDVAGFFIEKDVVVGFSIYVSDYRVSGHFQYFCKI